jgi:thioredoxin 1
MYRAYKDLSPTLEEQNRLMSFHPEVILEMSRKQEIIETNKIVCIDLFGDYCYPCKIIAPKFAELAKKYNTKGEIYLCTEDVEKGLTPDCTGVPMFLFYFNGRYTTSIIGGNLEEVEKELNRLINRLNQGGNNYQNKDNYQHEGRYQEGQDQIMRSTQPNKKFQNFHGRSTK